MQRVHYLAYDLFVQPTAGHDGFGFACKILLNLEKRQIGELKLTLLKFAIEINASA